MQARGDDLAGCRLCLMSPWVDLFADNLSYAKFKDDDLLNATWLSYARRHYLGVCVCVCVCVCVLCVCVGVSLCRCIWVVWWG